MKVTILGLKKIAEGGDVKSKISYASAIDWAYF